MFSFLSKKLSGILNWLNDKGRLTEENVATAVNQVREALLEADVPLNIVETFLQEIGNAVVGQKVQSSLNPGQQFIKIVNDKVVDFLGGKLVISPTFQIPSVIMVMGLQGSGKTTTVAKLAYWMIQQAKQRHKTRNILVASVDFYRPAAIDQLEILSKTVGVSFYRAKSTSATSAALEIYDQFKKGRFDHLILDTAGRLHIDTEMMSELVTIKNSLTPKYKILVLDAMTGQESLKVAESFEKAVGFDGAILTKMDSDTRGGAAFAFRYALKKPISFVGTGEKIDDLECFIPDRMAGRILGMGDILTLVEQASEKIDYQEQKNLTEKILGGGLTLEDFREQLGMIDRLGSLQKISRYLPGMGSVTPEMMEKGHDEMKRFKAIIDSMTIKERKFPVIIDGSRRARIAKGSGVTVSEVNQLLQRFEQSKQYAKMFKKMGVFKRFMS